MLLVVVVFYFIIIIRLCNIIIIYFIIIMERCYNTTTHFSTILFGMCSSIDYLLMWWRWTIIRQLNITYHNLHVVVSDWELFAFKCSCRA